ncbi:Nuclear factor (Erythroid-derived 2)-like 2 [Cichlidogyrus casuarinus]|uniref:Nuclear factor (Erythroid-derived 2)-like 2 n=1 Tax=Cichlidogyrus casuarinus TaxID=1844966 RepID=A0ABD2Q0S4_9PLAT
MVILYKTVCTSVENFNRSRKLLLTALTNPQYSLSLRVNVLLTELYPNKLEIQPLPSIEEGSASNAEDSVCNVIKISAKIIKFLQDYLVCLQKVCIDEYPEDPLATIESMSILASTSSQSSTPTPPSVKEEPKENTHPETNFEVKNREPKLDGNKLPPYSFTRAQQRKPALSISTGSIASKSNNSDDESFFSSSLYDSESSEDGDNSRGLHTTGIGVSAYHSKLKRHSIRTDRYMTKDIALLKKAKIPFSYHEIVSCSNTEFRVIKNHAGLKSNQVNIVLNARKRAANRQAAERCRKSKIMARDTLSDVLHNLSLEKEDIAKKLSDVRYRRQNLRDQLFSLHQQLIKSLRTADEKEFHPSAWRVHAVGDELVLMPAPRASADFKKQFNQVHANSSTSYYTTVNS